MEFQLPAEYEGFVSSADELLREFGSAAAGEGSEDRLSFSLHPDPEHASLERLIILRDSICTYLEEYTRGYIWHCEAPCLYVSASPPHICGSLRFGDNVEDEWFTTHFLWELSRTYPYLSLSMIDGDGEYLLIEAADQLPDWLGPSNCLNRIWLRAGVLHIVPLEEAGRVRSGGITLSAALEAVREGWGTVADEQVQLCLSRRLGEFPTRSLASMHTSTCIIPRQVAEALHSNPQLISSATHSLSISRMDGAKWAKRLTKFSAKDFVVADIRFSRALYAQLSFFQNFRAPKDFDTIVGELVAAEKRELVAALDVGTRVTVGLEVAYQVSKCRGTTSGERTTEWQALQSALAKISPGITADKARFYFEACSLRADSKSPPSSSEVHELISQALATSTLRQIPFRHVAQFSTGESDSWLHLTPDEFDAEMAARTRSMDGLPTAETGETRRSHIPAPPSTDKGMDDIIAGVESFFRTESEVSGVGEAEAGGPIEDGLPLDMTKLMAMLNASNDVLNVKAAAVESDSGGEEEDDADDYNNDDDDDGDNNNVGEEENSDDVESAEVKEALGSAPKLLQTMEAGIRSFTMRDAKWRDNSNTGDSADSFDSDDEFYDNEEAEVQGDPEGEEDQDPQDEGTFFEEYSVLSLALSLADNF
jgi:hypothetical protein